jgi:hypothetical protein
MKKVTFGSKPMVGSKATHGDDWVLAREQNTEPVKRLTIDMPLSLHRRVKSRCALENLRMADVVRELLEQRFPDETPNVSPSPTVVNPQTQKHGES